jgi:hypothetical protein
MHFVLNINKGKIECSKDIIGYINDVVIEYVTAEMITIDIKSVGKETRELHEIEYGSIMNKKMDRI